LAVIADGKKNSQNRIEKKKGPFSYLSHIESWGGRKKKGNTAGEKGEVF